MILQINNLSKRYGAIQALNSLSLYLEQGNVLGILGPNGSGKTTTLAIILGIIKADGGSFRWFDGLENETVNQRIGTLLESPYFYPYLTVLQNLKIIGEIKDIIDYAEFERVLKVTNLYERQHSQFSTLSFGMKQRLALAVVLLGDPAVLIFDEPTNGLDPEGIAEVREIIKAEAAKGKTIILASHILDEVEKVCTHVAILKKGNLVAHDEVNKLMPTNDIIIISSENLDVLYEAMVRSGMYKTINKSANQIELTLQDKFEPKDLNAYAFKNGLVLSKFEVKKKRLEEQFLELVK